MIRRSSGDQVASHIRRMVFNGEYRPGDRVRQDEIAAELGVSRIPVREAIIALEREGWVTVEPHRGAFVRGVDAAYVRDHYELYGLVHGLMASRVAERADDDGLRSVLAAAAAVAEAEADPAVFNAANRAFLQCLDEAAEAPRLSSMARVMTNVVPGNFFRQIPGAIETQRRGVAAAARALQARDGERARAELRELLRRQGEAVVALLTERGLFSPPVDRAAAGA